MIEYAVELPKNIDRTGKINLLLEYFPVKRSTAIYAYQKMMKQNPLSIDEYTKKHEEIFFKLDPYPLENGVYPKLLLAVTPEMKNLYSLSYEVI